MRFGQGPKLERLATLEWLQTNGLGALRKSFERQLRMSSG